MRAYLTATAASLIACRAARPDVLVVDAALLGSSAPPVPSRMAGESALGIRLGAVEEAGFAADLSAAMAFAPPLIVLPVGHGRDLADAGARLAVEEAERGLPDGALGIVALVASAAGALAVASLVGATPRLRAVGWDAAALAAELGLARPAGRAAWVPPLAHIRSQIRLAAAAARVEAIEAACPAGAGPGRHAERARRDGFGAVFAADPEGVAAIRSAEVTTAWRSRCQAASD